jgi:hypothetical protein
MPLSGWFDWIRKRVSGESIESLHMTNDHDGQEAQGFKDDELAENDYLSFKGITERL